MYEFHPYFTNDGSVGLFSPNFNDIYHSATGALTESYEKFILPVDFNKLIKKDSIRVLDICYGIGYNSKSFLNNIFEKFSQKNHHAKNNIAQIYTNKKSRLVDDILSVSTDKIHGDNIFCKLSIDTVDNDKILTFLSPFIKTGEKRIRNKNIDFDYNKIQQYLKADKKNKPIRINKLINFLIFEKMVQNTPEILENEDVFSILNNNKYRSYFDQNLRGIYNYYRFKSVQTNRQSSLFTFLHNIYYRHVSNGYKRALKRYQLQDININLNNGDAREFIKNNNSTYDLIFLDAFTPSKCPCLWSYEFFMQLFNHLDDDGMILTYSTSASIRSAMIEAGFKIGYIYNEREDKFTGTIAVKNNALIKYPLSDFDLGLLKTTAGIFYRDKNLTSLNEAIIHQRKIEVENSSRISTSKYKKNYNRETKC